MSTSVRYLPEQRDLDLSALSYEDYELLKSWRGYCSAKEPVLWCTQPGGGPMYVRMYGGNLWAVHHRKEKVMSDQSARVRTVEVLDARRVRVGFTDGLTRDIDLAPLLWGPVFAEIRDDDAAFAAVTVDPQLGTLVWPNGADIDPDVLHGDHPPAEQQAPAA